MQKIFLIDPQQSVRQGLWTLCDYESDYTGAYTLVIGCETSSAENLPEGLAARVLPASKYALYDAVGEFSANLIDVWTQVWSTPFKRTYVGDFELYGETAPTEVPIYIGID